MSDANFEWDDANIAHVAEHDVTPEEAEQALLNDPLELGFDAGPGGEERWAYLGETDESRMLQVVITLRGERIRVVTAFEPVRRLRVFYLETKAEQK
jgi:uncharacterized DUF497 family protein